MRRRKRSFSQADLRAMGATPGLQAVRYTPDGARAEVRQLTAEASSKPSLFKAQRLTSSTIDRESQARPG